jgi:hypothetical protein
MAEDETAVALRLLEDVYLEAALNVLEVIGAVGQREGLERRRRVTEDVGPSGAGVSLITGASG